MALEVELLPLKDFLNTFYKEYTDFKPQNKQEFKDKIESYLQNYKQNKNQNEPAIVANALAPFLQSLGFQAQAAYKHKGNSEIDLSLLKDSNVEILIEAKKPSNKAEMFSQDVPNCKALHECILYYFRERENGTNLKYIIITDFLQFYFFSAKEFERHFYKHKGILKAYESFKNKDLLENQKDFYAEISKILSGDFAGDREGDLFNTNLQGLYFDLRNDKHLNTAHKILTREFLHHEYKRDPNALNPRFYKELLYILGLKEVEKGGKFTIEFDDTQSVSFAKHIASKLESHNKPSDFEAVMSHILLWLNRVLFLKLIEANLLCFNDFTKDLRFLSSDKIKSFKLLNHLFFEVLARDYEARESDKGFNFLPYLNSSLFLRDEKLEILDIGSLDDDLEIQIFESTQTTHKKDKTCKFLAYLFDFLNAFDFGKRQEDLAQEDFTSKHKDLIRSSVLGAVFEKLNGYKEGSFYTPSFITSYMCKESLQKIVIEKFNATFEWSAQSLEDLRKRIDREFENVESQAKQVLSSIRICDPSVGSGHFLVSALNEMIYIYYRLGLLDFTCKDFEIQEDEIYFDTKNNKPFAYKRVNDENHEIQQKLFMLKKSIIENNLFGVDINPNSCNIARLRLWIELLKNAYYLNFSHDRDSKIHKLQTLPNIDINIKCGNSLVSRFSLNDSLKSISNINEQIKKYKQLVFDYKNADQNVLKISKKDIESQIEAIKQTFTLTLKDPKTKKELEKAINIHINKFNTYLLDDESLLDGLSHFQYNLYGTPNLSQEEQEEALQSYGKIQALRKKLDLALSGAEYKDAMEWRFAFPEVLDSNGDFVGFDLVIGNPPYIDYRKINETTKLSLQKNSFIYANSKTGSIFVYFIEKAAQLIHKQGYCIFINPINYICQDSGSGIREFIDKNLSLIAMIDISNFKVFDSASTYTCINYFTHKTNAIKEIKFGNANNKETLNSITFKTLPQTKIENLSTLLNPITTKIFKANYPQLSSFCDIFCALSIAGFRSDVKKEKTKDNVPFLESSDIQKYDYKQGKFLNKSQSYFSAEKIKIFEDSEIIFMARMTNLFVVALLLMPTLEAKLIFCIILRLIKN